VGIFGALLADLGWIVDETAHILGKFLDYRRKSSYIRYVDITAIGEQIAARRKKLGLSQAELASKAGIGHSTLNALENGRLGELGLTRIAKVLSVLGMELKLEEAAGRRPTLEERMEVERDDQGVDRRR